MTKLSLSNSWKTSVGGILAAIGAVLMGAESMSHNVKMIGKILVAVGPLIIGFSARDNDKSSEQVGAGVIPPAPVTVVPPVPTSTATPPVTPTPPTNPTP